jgi:hypothetical protein
MIALPLLVFFGDAAGFTGSSKKSHFFKHGLKNWAWLVRQRRHFDTCRLAVTC